MGKASSSKKVARAARTGGGRTSRGRTPWMWYTTMGIVVVLGVLLVGISRADLGSQANAVAPIANKDHWHAAIGFFVCDKYVSPPQDPNPEVKPDVLGVHTHGDGLVHIHPFSRRAAGKN